MMPLVSFENSIKLIGLSFKTRREYDLLVKYSLAISAFWFLVLIAPSVPYANKLPIIMQYAEYSKTGFFIFSIRTLLLFLVPLIFGFFYLASDEFLEKNKHNAIRAEDYFSGLRILSQKYDLKSRELIFLSFAALGKGLGLVLNWIIIYTFIVISVVSEFIRSLLTDKKRSSFFELWRFQDKNEIINKIGDSVGETSIYDTVDYTAAPLLLRPLLLFGKIFFGEFSIIHSKNVDIMITDSGIGATGSLRETRDFYKKLVDYAFQSGTLCKHPTSIEIESEATEPIPYERILEDHEIPIEDLKWIRLKELLKKR